MSLLFRLSSTCRRDPLVDKWLAGHDGELGEIARRMFTQMRECGEDVREAVHDGCPTACIGDAAFAYVNVYSRHMNVGFFRGAELSDPNKLMEGTGKLMRHVKLRASDTLKASGLNALIVCAYDDMRRRVRTS